VGTEGGEVRERPILFSGPMVKALMAGTKTQTRRILKGTTEHKGPYNPAYLEAHKNSDGWAQICPYGQPGDRLWVRETWAPCFGESIKPGAEILYRADDCDGYDRLTWRPSIHMPRWASRLTLEITEVRVQRLQEISYEDCLAEGIHLQRKCLKESVEARFVERPDKTFARLWDSINAKRGYPWSANCFVWALTFRRVP
jgi:hypothetical protein